MKFTNYVRAGFLLVASGWAFGYSCFAAAPIIIKGQMSIPNAEGLTIMLNYCPDYYATSDPIARGIKYTTRVKNGSFEFRIENPASFAYIEFEYGQFNSFHHFTTWNMLNGHQYLIGDDSVISINISGDQCTFSERSRLLECQYTMYEYAFKDTQSIYIYNDDYLDNYKRQKAHYDSLYQGQLKILKQYENSFKPVFTEVLKLDFFADWALRDLNVSSIEHVGIDLNYSLLKEPENLNYHLKKGKAVVQYYLDNHLFHQYDTSHPEIKVLSRSYADFLFQKHFCDIALSMRASGIEVWPSFSQIMEKIDESFTGVLKEKVLASGFLSYYIRGAATEQDLDRALAQMKHEEYRSIVKRIKDTRGYGQPAFNFRLQDSSGNVVTQEMLKGKFVILDFWFTGCTGCAFLNKQMTPVFDHFKSNPDVVFVTISSDHNLNNWRNLGLKSGLYTHPGSINLHTNGLGDKDPVIKYYDVTGYPTLILINKEGKIVSSAPIKPVSPESCRRFIELVEQHL